ncbi:MAG: hypothetical protein J6S71_09595, partial [Clostridia bacterium]|nr:hypothetical protein [Clostridia bacterium]
HFRKNRHQKIGKMVAKLVTRKNCLNTREKILNGYFHKKKDKTLKNAKQTFVKTKWETVLSSRRTLRQKRSQISALV